MNIFLLSNVNVQPLVRTLRPWTAHCGAYNSMLADLSVPGSPACADDITHVFCLYDTDSLFADSLYSDKKPELCEAFLGALEAFCERETNKTVLSNTFSLSSSRSLNFADTIHPASLKAREADLNARLVAIARTHSNLLLLDLDLLFRRYGESSLVSDAFWYAARIRYTARMFDLLGATIKQAISAHKQNCRKLLILDLDNTLWGGVVGEAGPFGITLSEDGTGRCYRDLQRCLKALMRTGVLLAIVSKNNSSDVDDVFDKNKMMILHREDFVSIRANWRPKAENIVEISAELGLGLDSFVYIDDSPVERDSVRNFLPEVVVPDFPAAPEQLARWFVQDIAPAYFGKYAVTAEDATKIDQYKANEARRKLAASFDLDGYLDGLGIVCAVNIDPTDRLARAAQMTQKTNQFNLTTRRYDVTDLARFVKSDEHAVLMLDYSDRFGDEGAVGLAIVDLAGAYIDSLLMSCRVIGRKVEDRLLNEVIKLCHSRGHRKVLGEYIPTRKNEIAAQFYERNGFAVENKQSDGRIIYEKVIDDR